VRRPVVLLVVLVLVLAGAGAAAFYLTRSSSTDYDPVAIAPRPGTPPADQPPDPALATYYSQKLDWQACGEDDCTTLTVPLDYADPGGETIGIHVVRRPADDEGHRVGSLLVNPGGPGSAGSAMATSASSYLGPSLLRYYDVVGFDPRGTGQSDPVDCLSDSDLDAYLAADPEPDTPTEEKAYVREARSMGRGCAAQSGALAAHISTEEAARDMDVLRAALGDAVTSYLGYSYGTELGATYATLFPDRVARVVLDGAVDPTLDVEQAALTQAHGFETALRAYVQNCLDVTDSCFLGDSLDAGLQRIRDLLDQVDATPLTTSSGRPLTLGLAITGIITPLYDRGTWIVLSQALRSAFDGDGSTLLLLADAYSGRQSDGTFASNLLEAFPAISCLDDPEGVRPAKVPSLVPAFEKAAPTFGESFAWGLIGCRGWPPARDVPRERLVIDAKGAPPIVVIGTTRDPATPIEEAEALASQLVTGVLVTRDGDGHTAYHSGNDCIDTAVESYLVEGRVPESGLAC
jgi:pimeloyl-ACP methyl ester carboxylesterase